MAKTVIKRTRNVRTKEDLAPGILLFTIKESDAKNNLTRVRYEVESRDAVVDFTVDITGSKNMQIVGAREQKTVTSVPAGSQRTLVATVEPVDKALVSYALNVSFSLEQINENAVDVSIAAQEDISNNNTADENNASLANSSNSKQVQTQEMSPGILLFTIKESDAKNNLTRVRYEVESRDAVVDFTVDITGSKNMQIVGAREQKTVTSVPAGSQRTLVATVEPVDKALVSYALNVSFSLE